nr:classA [uncultured bacterium]AMP57394.1 classA [uncultured bacterium]
MNLAPVLAAMTFVFFSSMSVPAQTTTTLTRRDVSQAFKLAKQKSQGNLGAAVMDFQTGECIDINGDLPFPMQSVYKLPIAINVLSQVDKGTLKLDQRIQVTPADYVTTAQHSPLRDKHPDGIETTLNSLLELMAGESDGSACDVLLRLTGGPRATSRFLQEIGTTAVHVLNTEKEIGANSSVQYANTATANATVGLLKTLYNGRTLSEESRSRLLNIMTNTPTGPRRIKGKLPPTYSVAHKTGSSRTVDGVTAATNDVGIITFPDGRAVAIAVFVNDSRADSATRDEVIADVAAAALKYFSAK